MADINLPTVMGWSLGALSSIVGFLVAYCAIRAARALGGEIGKAFVKVATGTVFVIIGVLFFGYIHTMTLQGRTTGMFGAIGVNFFLFTGYFFMLTGFRGITKSTKI